MYHNCIGKKGYVHVNVCIDQKYIGCRREVLHVA